MLRILWLAPIGGLAACTRAESAPAAAGIPPIRLVSAYPELTFERPVWMEWLPDGSGRVVVVEQAGRILVFPDSADAQRFDVFLDIRSKVRSYLEHDNEEGLLALAFHPDFKNNRSFFVHYSASGPPRGVLSRFKASAGAPNRADPASEEVMLEIQKPYGNHNGATLLFAPDRYLYLSIGDGGSKGDPHGNGQSLSTLLAKILRIDVNRSDAGLNYAIPPSNPFVGRPGARGEIWAYGLRNVWRMSFDRQTGDLWAADVGQGRWEEIDLIVKGGNYGWNTREGRHAHGLRRPSGPLIDPIAEYGHEQGLSVTGGYVYRGTRWPSLRGVYLYADYITGTFWGLRFEGGAVRGERIVLRQPKNIASFAESPDGELYVLAFDGKIYRIEAVE